MKLALVQPSLRREWSLRRGDEIVATLWIPLFRRRAAAEVTGRRLTFEREGGLRSAYRISDAMTDEQLARFRPEGRHRFLELGDRRAEWKHLGRGQGYGFVGPDGEALLRAKVASGIARTNGEVEVADDLPEQDALVAAVLASFLLIRKAEETAAASSGAVTASS
ncbi:MAG: hypothetical protein WBB76_11550 [Gaiellaceae bacterium]